MQKFPKIEHLGYNNKKMDFQHKLLLVFPCDEAVFLLPRESEGKTNKQTNPTHKQKEQIFFSMQIQQFIILGNRKDKINLQSNYKYIPFI